MYKFLLLASIPFVFQACSSNSALTYFKKDALETRAIQYTKKTDLLFKNEVEVLFTSTYLNNIKKDLNTKNNMFIVSLYFVNQETQDLNKNGYFLTLNKQKPIKIQELKKDDITYKNIIKNNNWAKSYLVEFPDMKDNYNLILKLAKPKITKGSLKFLR